MPDPMTGPGVPEPEGLSRQERVMLDAWLVGADFPMAPVVRRLLAHLAELEGQLEQAKKTLANVAEVARANQLGHVSDAIERVLAALAAGAKETEQMGGD